MAVAAAIKRSPCRAGRLLRAGDYYERGSSFMDAVWTEALEQVSLLLKENMVDRALQPSGHLVLANDFIWIFLLYSWFGLMWARF